MQNPLAIMMLNQLKMRNPQAYQMVSKAIENNGNPQDMLKEITSKYDDKTKQQFVKQAEQFGFTKEYIKDVINI